MRRNPPEGQRTDSDYGGVEPIGLPREFSVTYLHVGQTVHHELGSDRIRWFLAESQVDVYEHQSRSVLLAEDLWLVVFRKGPSAALVSTYLVFDLRAGAVFDATYLPDAPGSWRFDRGAIGNRVTLGTPMTFPRIDVRTRTGEELFRGFSIRDGLVLLVTSDNRANGAVPCIELRDLHTEPETQLFIDTPWLP